MKDLMLADTLLVATLRHWQAIMLRAAQSLTQSKEAQKGLVLLRSWQQHWALQGAPSPELHCAPAGRSPQQRSRSCTSCR